MNCLIYIIAANEEEADKLMTSLLEKRLVACVNYFPVRSKFWWKGKLETDSEIALIGKSREELKDKIIEEVRKIHSYDVPVIDIIPIASSYDLLDNWLTAETTKE